jgi:hypothetical protein
MHIVADKTLSDTEKGFYLAAIKAMTRIRDKGSEFESSLADHIKKEEQYWKRMEPVILRAERWEENRKKVRNLIILISVIVAWMLDVGHHAKAILETIFTKKPPTP